MTTTNSDPRLTQAAIETIRIAIGDRNPTINQISAPNNLQEAVVDRTYKYLVTSSLGAKYVLIVSNAKFPTMVSRAVSRLQEARAVLRSETQSVVEMPISHGSWEGVSYALWLFRTPLNRNRIRLFAQKRLLAPKVLTWLSTVVQQTRRDNLTSDDVRNNFAEPLAALIAHPKLSATFTRAGQIALGRIARGDFKPVHVLQHGDLWLGNVLIKGSLELLSPLENGFIVIDWGGAKVAGYPFFDLLIFSMSCNRSPRTTARHIHSMSNIIPCEPADAICYVLCALGKLYQELENFHERNFLSMCESSIDYLVAAGLDREFH